MRAYAGDLLRNTGTFDPDIEVLLGPDPVARSAQVAAPGRVSAIAGEAYDGSSRFSRELMMWNPGLNSADSDILPDKAMLDARTRDVLRNDSYVAGGADLHRDNIVGGLFVVNAKPEWKVLGLTEKWAEAFQEEVETKFTLWAESPNNWVDAARMNTLTSLVRLAVGVFVASGEVLASVEWLRDSNRPFNTAIQMIDIDRLSNPYNEMDKPECRGGVQRNRNGAPMGYHIQMAHPTDWAYPDSYSWKYVPVRKPWGRLQMIHIIEQMRPDQTRGISAMVSALKELRITKRFRDIVLQNAVVNATYAASIESDLPSETVFAALGGNSKTPVTDYATEWLGAVAAYAGNSKNLQIDGVKIPHLFPGTKLQLRPAGQGGPLGTEFEQSLLRYIAANLGVSYEQLSRDYSQTNYSSIRAAMTETWKYMQSRKRMVADRFASQIYTLWLEEAINKGQISSMPKNAPNWYEGLNAEAYASCEWIGASRGQIDELKETQAAVLRLKYNLSTWEDEHARLGKDWRKVFAQRQREKQVQEERGITPEQDDNMVNAVSGSPREKESKGEKRDGSEDNTDE